MLLSALLFQLKPRRTRNTAVRICLCLAVGACATAEPGPTDETTITRPETPVNAPAAKPAQAQPPAPSRMAELAPQPASAPNEVRLSPPPPRIVPVKRRLQCVPYARRQSNIAIRGDAWTWWRKARGRYERGTRPEVGSVLVFRRKSGGRGHLAVVRRVVSGRELIIDHANWLNRGRIHLNTPVRDESPNNDWSVVRVWYTPGNVWGKSRYPAYGFIYPDVQTAER